MHIIIFTAFIKAADLFFFFYCPFFFICSTSLTMNSIVFLACHTCTYKPRLYSIPIDEIQKFLFMAKKKKWILLSILGLVTPTWAFRPIEY